MATYNDNESFKKDIFPQYPLDDAIEWIQAHMSPEDVFTEMQLHTWAEENIDKFDTSEY